MRFIISHAQISMQKAGEYTFSPLTFSSAEAPAGRELHSRSFDLAEANVKND